MNDLDVVVIGGGQAGLAVGHYLRRTGLRYVILDEQTGPGGAWRHGWDSLHLFSPAWWSSLPGWPMRKLPDGTGEYPTRDETIAYLAAYEEHYGLPVRRPVHVAGVWPGDNALRIETDTGAWSARAVVSATGTWRSPYVPDYPGRDCFRGEQLHSAHYRSPDRFVGQRVLVVGGGNSGAQVLADVSRVADATWVTRRQPRFLPDDVDGRTLFNRASEKYRAINAGTGQAAQASELPQSDAGDALGDIVMVAPVREARDRGVLHAFPSFERFTERGVVWPDGREEHIDVVIWCTGFGSSLNHLRPLGVVDRDGHVELDGTRSVKEPRLWLVGYGNWTGYASATLVGVGRTARAAVNQIATELQSADHATSARR